MSHTEQLEFIKITQSLFPEKFVHQKVLEIGSLDVNGTIRNVFRDCDYIGIDVAEGPGVDLPCEGQNYDAPTGSFGVVVCCEVMEHNPYWKETLSNMIRLLAPGGLLIMSCATVGRPEHGTSRSHPDSSPLTVELGWDYYRNLSRKDITENVDLSALGHFGFVSSVKHWDLFMLGIKRGLDKDESSAKIAKFQRIYRKKRREELIDKALYITMHPSRILAFIKRVRTAKQDTVIVPDMGNPPTKPR